MENEKLKRTRQIAISIAIIVVSTVLLISVLSNLIIKNQFTKYKEKQQVIKIEELVSSIEAQYDVKENKWNEEIISNIGMSALHEGYIIKIYDENKSIFYNK